MQIDNINNLSLLLFFCIFVGSITLFIYNYVRRERLKKKYTLLFAQQKAFYLRYICLIFSAIILSFSIFKIGYYQEASLGNRALDIVFVLDVSKSMNTIDVDSGSYSRIEYSKSQIIKYITENPSNRYSLVIFAGDSISISPLSNNIDNFIDSLARVDYQNIGKQGTDLVQAIKSGYDRFSISDGDIGKALILISDGGDSDSIDFQNIKDINSQNIASFVFGVGSIEGGPIPLGKNPFGENIYQKYQGKTVITKINTNILKQLANSIDGKYDSLEEFNKQLDHIEKKAIKKSKQKNKIDIAGYLAYIAYVFFILYLIFPYLYKGKK